eukprot:Plantae.Rhodophyta-Rhodochaete_pulchella.ctg3223.p1 GENE.Plantae.Rhodophyta-Rhodochaete_pulchella.ctg3223~~Plantae.Rhodophyta-Rhodochaete_pulchella.ctg3223.p1  ORF type:complete len:372 (-),score=53.17 Plantae.Rhodophyta-Rhodochaete_pulchella.ctg3223:60-1076(-)
MVAQEERHHSVPRFIHFEDMYVLHSLIGRGRTGEVWLGYRRNAQNVDLAVKVLLKDSGKGDVNSKEALMKRSRVREEVEITKLLNNPNIIRTHDFFDNDERRVYIVMDLMVGGTLMDALVRSRRTFSEATARFIMTRVLRGVAYIHDEGIIHRDIRPGNIMCSRSKLPCELKLSDFGYAHDIVDNSDAGDDSYRVVSGLYHSPEIARGQEAGPEVDVWSCGVLMYFLLTGTHPFVGRNVKSTHERILFEQASFRGPRWRRLSPEAHRLCRLLLEKERYRRPEARDVLDHPWFKVSEQKLHLSPLNIDWEFARYEMEKKDRSMCLEFLEIFGLRDDVPD